jgi:hypothetical protein
MDSNSLIMTLPQTRPQSTNRFIFHDNSDEDGAEDPSSELLDEDSFEDAQAVQFSQLVATAPHHGPPRHPHPL